MTRSVTLTALQTAVRQRVNLENSGFVTDAELTDLINRAVAELHDVLAGINGDMRLEKESSITTSANTRTYALPSDFLTVTSVWFDAGTGQLVKIEPYMPREAQDDWQASGWSYLSRVTYRLQGANIRFVPLPSGRYTVTLKYIPTSTVLSSGGDTIDSVNGWDEWVLAQVCALVCAKSESDPSFWMAERDRQLHRIRHAAERTVDGPQRIQDVRAIRPWPFSRRWS